MTIHFLNTKPSKRNEIGHNLDPSILANISVTKPYFALSNLSCYGDYIYAEFTTELTNIDEEGPIGAAEVGRHLAILGSVVLAKENPKNERHHYLATDATITRCSSKTSVNYTLTCRAKMVFMNRKKGVVEGEIFDHDGTVLYKIEVTYMILGKMIFERMFAQHQMETLFTPDFNPYKTDAQFVAQKLDVKSCYASIGTVTKEDCPGHFNNFPALPVARLGTSIGKIGGLHFMHLNPSDKKKYLISNVELHARQLIFVGEEIKFRTEIVDPNPEKGMIIKIVVYSDNCDFIAEAIINYHY